MTGNASELKFTMSKVRKLTRDYAWGVKLFLKLSTPLGLCMVRRVRLCVSHHALLAV